ncbi:TauD/TfdA family dioxygenase [Nonomuraea angiospora]|uniref:TauD/TfdA family dioxygenase n=1 Tax=Nonomuraea angiospora TaxID=46172 RepID=UPI003440C456
MSRRWRPMISPQRRLSKVPSRTRARYRCSMTSTIRYTWADPYFMRVDPVDHEAADALALLVKQMDDKMVDMALESGEFCFIDNYRVVHGRKPFSARHDGMDRWLKRINVTRDLRKSRARRRSRTERSIH